jgi:hypothetical protein
LKQFGGWLSFNAQGHEMVVLEGIRQWRLRAQCEKVPGMAAGGIEGAGKRV